MQVLSAGDLSGNKNKTRPGKIVDYLGKTVLLNADISVLPCSHDNVDMLMFSRLACMYY